MKLKCKWCGDEFKSVDAGMGHQSLCFRCCCILYYYDEHLKHSVNVEFVDFMWVV